jgi:hypothetical protein
VRIDPGVRIHLGVKIEKSSLAATLLEIGEENAAVLLIRSPLPDLLDTQLDLPALAGLGLDAETIDELVATAVERRAPNGDDGRRFDETVSRRCADLVRGWTSSRQAP